MRKLNIIVPMAGRGTRFIAAGFGVPKPMISVNGTPMIVRALENVTDGVAAHLVFVCVEEDLVSWPAIEPTLRGISPSATVVSLNERPRNPIDSFLAGLATVSGEAPVLSINCDQYIAISGAELLDLFLKTETACAAFLMEVKGSSYARVSLSDDGARITEVLGKNGDESRPALTGLYVFSSPGVARESAFAANSRQKPSEICISESLHECIRAHRPVGAIPLGAEGGVCSTLGDPLSLEKFIHHKNSDS